MTKPNIYIKALEIGFNSGNDGISYNELSEQLKKYEFNLNDKAFWIWYLANFEHEERAYFSVDPCSSRTITETSKSIAYELCADSVMKFIEYLELKESRESTKKALKQAKIAIIIAIVSIILNLLQSVLSSELTSDNFYNRQKNTKTDLVLESQVKEELEYSNSLSDELNNRLEKLKVRDTIKLDK